MGLFIDFGVVLDGAKIALFALPFVVLLMCLVAQAKGIPIPFWSKR